MAEESSDALAELTLDRENLYLEETITDLRVGSLRRLTPITESGATDTGREILYLGQAQVMSQMGALPLNFRIDATTLEEALDGFHPAAEEAVKEMVEQVREMQRQQASQIVVPGAGGGGGFSPTGKIQIP
ncbi:MAG: hypothetical protein K0U93_11690 [Gammaproteobacteria bacterium]|nr:hypothetical protein [Gammaproteobacteria bacterium]